MSSSGDPTPPPDPGLRAVLEAFGVAERDLLGGGGEARVYALDPGRVLRVLHEQGPDDIRPRSELVGELRASGPVPFDLPEIQEVGAVGDRTWVIERRLPGTSVADLLARLDGSARRALVVAHLQAAARLGDLALRPRPWLGDLIAPDPVRAPTWRAYAERKVAASLSRAPGFEYLDPEALAAALPHLDPDGDRPSFVHLDAFAGNMLADGDRITAVLDIGYTSVLGDRRLDPVTAAVYLCSDEITPAATGDDRAVAHRWLSGQGLDRWYEPVRRWIAGYWAHAVDDANLHRWCRRVLL